MSFVYKGLAVLIADLLALNFVPMRSNLQVGLILGGVCLLAMIFTYWIFEGDE